MKAKILLLIIFSGLILGCCRSKQKITSVSREVKKEMEQVKADSSSVQHTETIHNASAQAEVTEKKDEISGDLLISGKSDPSNPFVFHNVIGKDTVQSISIMGNAEYSISNRYAKASNGYSESKKEKSADILQHTAQKAVSKEMIKEKNSVVSQETKKIKVSGFEITAWIFLTVMGITLILMFFTYKYFKK